MERRTFTLIGLLIAVINLPISRDATAQHLDPASDEPEPETTQPDAVGASTRAHADTHPDTTVIDLDRLIQEALRSNPELEAAYLRADALATESLEARTLPDPMAGLTYQPRPILTARGFQRSQWRFEQAIPFPGKLRLRGEVAELGADVARSEAGILGEDLILSIKEAYDELHRIQEQQRLIRDFQSELRDFERSATVRYEVGEGLQQSILRAQLERNALKIRLEKLEEEHRSALEELAYLLDRPDLDGLQGTAVARTPQVEVGNGVLERALAARPDAEAVRREIDRSERNVNLARREFLPDFMVSVNYFDIGAGGAMPTATGRDAIALNVGVKLPLWLGKQRANLEQAKLEQNRGEARLQSLRTEIRTEIADLSNRLERQANQLLLLEDDLIPQARTTVQATLSAYSTGRTSFLDLLDAERMLFNLRTEQVDTRTRYLKTTAALERALGTSLDR